MMLKRSQNDYDLVSETCDDILSDENNHNNCVAGNHSNAEMDERIPLHTDSALSDGVLLRTKLVGTSEITRPSNRLDIVTSMRRIRYEFKSKSIGKRRVTLHVSRHGVKLFDRKRRMRHLALDDESLLISHYPIHRIFYVSHDSQDVKLFCYIVRESGTNRFKCSVFKSSKKRQALRAVRTIGQSFEAPHQTGCEAPHSASTECSRNTQTLDELLRLDAHLTQPHSSSDPISMDLDYERVDTLETQLRRIELFCRDQLHKYGATTAADGSCQTPGFHLDLLCKLIPDTGVDCDVELTDDLYVKAEDEEVTAPSILKHEIRVVREKILHQSLQYKAALSQITHLRQQIQAETQTRVEAQSRVTQLLNQHSQLLALLKRVVCELRHLYITTHSSSCNSSGANKTHVIHSSATLPTFGAEQNIAAVTRYSGAQKSRDTVSLCAGHV